MIHMILFRTKQVFPFLESLPHGDPNPANHVNPVYFSR